LPSRPRRSIPPCHPFRLRMCAYSTQLYTQSIPPAHRVLLTITTCVTRPQDGLEGGCVSFGFGHTPVRCGAVQWAWRACSGRVVEPVPAWRGSPADGATDCIRQRPIAGVHRADPPDGPGGLRRTPGISGGDWPRSTAARGCSHLRAGYSTHSIRPASDGSYPPKVAIADLPL
jgi:hypothetical protein